MVAHCIGILFVIHVFLHAQRLGPRVYGGGAREVGEFQPEPGMGLKKRELCPAEELEVKSIRFRLSNPPSFHPMDFSQ
jgi:hypothetical protein